jgi:hypothetical protein
MNIRKIEMTTSRMMLIANGSKERQGSLHTRVHGAGIKPNPMNRFMHSNSHEVLFVN